MNVMEVWLAIDVTGFGSKGPSLRVTLGHRLNFPTFTNHVTF